MAESRRPRTNPASQPILREDDEIWKMCISLGTSQILVRLATTVSALTPWTVKLARNIPT